MKYIRVRENIMNIVIKKTYLAQNKNIAGDGNRTHERLIQVPSPWPLGISTKDELTKEQNGMQCEFRYNNKKDKTTLNI